MKNNKGKGKLPLNLKFYEIIFKSGYLMLFLLSVVYFVFLYTPIMNECKEQRLKKDIHRRPISMVYVANSN